MLNRMEVHIAMGYPVTENQCDLQSNQKKKLCSSETLRVIQSDADAICVIYNLVICSCSQDLRMILAHACTWTPLLRAPIFGGRNSFCLACLHLQGYRSGPASTLPLPCRR